MKIFLYTKRVVGMIIPMMLLTMFIQGQTYSTFETSCTSKDLLLEDAEVTGGDQCNYCDEGTEIQRYLKLYINNKTGSVRTNFKFWATLVITDPATKESQEIPIEGCKGPVYPNSTNELVFGALPKFKCGSKLVLKNIIMAWTDASKGPKNDCANLLLSNITPKCGVLPEKVVRSGMIVFVTQTQGTCKSDGTPDKAAIDISVEGGTPGYTFAWTASEGGEVPSGQINSEDLTGIEKSGKYTVTITDSKNCTVTKHYNVTVKKLPSLSAALVQSNCNNGTPSDGSIDLTVSGGTGSAYTYNWSTSGGIIPGGQANSQDLSGIKKTGNYTVTVTGTDGCYQSTSYAITVLQAPSLSSSTVTQGTCGAAGNPGDASISITISGGTEPYTYTWTASNGGEIPDGKRNVEDLTGIKKSGNYTFTASDLNGCLYSNSVDITVPIPPTISCLSVVNSSCESGTPTLGAINIVVSGGKTDYRYAWTASNGGSVPANQSTAQNLSGISTSGSYSVVVTDANSCTAGSVYAVTVLIPPSVPQFTIIEQPDICGAAKGSLAISNNGSNLEYSFNGAAWTSNSTVGGIDAGSGPNYTISVRNIYGCISKVVGLCAAPSPAPTATKSTNLTTTVSNVAQPTAEVTQQTTSTNISNLGSATLEATLSVKAMPNPFNEQVRFTITSAEHGTATLDIYTVYGQKLKTVYKGMVNPGINYFDLKLASAQRTSELIYVFSMGTQKITGKLIQNAQ